MEEKRKPNMEDTIKSVGVTAEMGLIFFRATLGAGATMEEAMRMTQVYLYLSAILFGRPPAELEQGDE